MARSDRWIIGAGPDLLWFWASGFLALGLGAVAVAWPVLALPLFAAWMVFGDGPHFWATWTRSLWDRAERARRGTLLRRGFLLWVPGFLCWGLWAATGHRAPWELFLAGSAIWGIHHAVRQDYGLFSLYARRSGITPDERRWDSAFLYGLEWGLFAWFSVSHPLNRAEIGLDLPALSTGIVALLALASVVHGISLLVRAARGRPIVPGLFVLLACIGTTAIGYTLIGFAEPVIGGFTNIEQAFAVLALGLGLRHSLQYLGLVAWVGRNRYPQGGPGFGAWISVKPWRGFAIYALISIPYLGVNLLRGAAPGVHWSGPGLETFALCIYWGFVLHHYWLDQHIWRPHTDPALRADLRLA